MLMLAFMMLIFTPPEAKSSGSGELVYYIPVEQAVERGLEAFLERSISTAFKEI